MGKRFGKMHPTIEGDWNGIANKTQRLGKNPKASLIFGEKTESLKYVFYMKIELLTNVKKSDVFVGAIQKVSLRMDVCMGEVFWPY